MKSNWKLTVIVLLDLCAGLQFVRFYLKSASFYLNMPAYLSGMERMPFQARLLPGILMRAMLGIPHFGVWLRHSTGVIPAVLMPFYILSLVSLCCAAILTQWLYLSVSRSHALAALVFPAFLYVTGWTYLLHVEANFSYPYDLLSLAFFTAGLLCIYRRWFVPLVLVLLVGTVARETTLFLVGLYVLDAASTDRVSGTSRRLNVRQIPKARTMFLLAVWFIIHLTLAHLFQRNSHAEAYVRVWENLGRLRFRLLPAILNICGYLLPIVCLYWVKIEPRRFGNYLFILFLWLPVMFVYGDIVETRIYGELSSYTVVAAILLLEGGLAGLRRNKGWPADAASLPPSPSLPRKR